MLNYSCNCVISIFKRYSLTVGYDLIRSKLTILLLDKTLHLCVDNFADAELQSPCKSKTDMDQESKVYMDFFQLQPYFASFKFSLR